LPSGQIGEGAARFSTTPIWYSYFGESMEHLRSPASLADVADRWPVPNDHFVAFTETEGTAGEMACVRSVCDPDRVRRAG